MKTSGLERVALFVAGGILVGVPLLNLDSFKLGVLACAVGALLSTGVMAWVVIPDLNKEAREKGESSRGYSIGAVVLCFILTFCFLLYGMYLKGRYER
jgi:drug/metabolite transporter (DMT)-like permease